MTELWYCCVYFLSCSDYLCKPEDNVYSIDFTRFKIRDLETGTVLFEIAKPPHCGTLAFSYLYSSVWIETTRQCWAHRYTFTFMFWITVHSFIFLFHLKTEKLYEHHHAVCHFMWFMCIRSYSRVGLEWGSLCLSPFNSVLVSSLRCWWWRWRKCWWRHEYWPICSLSVHTSVS